MSPVAFWHDTESDRGYWEELWEAADRVKLLDLMTKKEWWPRLESLLAELSPRSVVLEAGCGLAPIVEILHRRGLHVVGVDLALGAMARARRAAPSLRLHAGDVRSLPLRDGAVDLYLSLGVVEHDESGPDAAVREAARVLADGGSLFLTTPYINVFRRVRDAARRGMERLRRVRAESSARGRARVFYQYAFSLDEISEVLLRHGFTVDSAQLCHTRVAIRHDLSRSLPAFHSLRGETSRSRRRVRSLAWALNAISPRLMSHVVAISATRAVRPAVRAAAVSGVAVAIPPADVPAAAEARSLTLADGAEKRREAAPPAATGALVAVYVNEKYTGRKLGIWRDPALEAEVEELRRQLDGEACVVVAGRDGDADLPPDAGPEPSGAGNPARRKADFIVSSALHLDADPTARLVSWMADLEVGGRCFLEANADDDDGRQDGPGAPPGSESAYDRFLDACYRHKILVGDRLYLRTAQPPRVLFVVMHASREVAQWAVLENNLNVILATPGGEFRDLDPLAAADLATRGLPRLAEMYRGWRRRVHDSRTSVTSPFHTAGFMKYFNYRYWAVRAAEVLACIEQTGVGTRLLDVGCGGGWLSYLARLRGYTPLGLDLPTRGSQELTLLEEVRAFLEVPTVYHQIRALEPLPRFATRFDAVAAINSVFSHDWGDEQYRFFLDDLRANVLDPERQTVVIINSTTVPMVDLAPFIERNAPPDADVKVIAIGAQTVVRLLIPPTPRAA